MLYLPDCLVINGLHHSYSCHSGVKQPPVNKPSCDAVDSIASTRTYPVNTKIIPLAMKVQSVIFVLKKR